MVGCDTQLVAPVTVGDDVYVASGTTIVREVSDGALVMSHHPQREKPGWTAGWHKRHENHPKARAKSDRSSERRQGLNCDMCGIIGYVGTARGLADSARRPATA